MKYIDADKLKAEIRHLKIDVYDEAHQFDIGARSSLTFLESLIDSLRQEEPDLPGIEESGIPGKDYIPVEWVDACEKFGKWKIVKQEQPEVDLKNEIERVVENYNSLANGCNVMKPSGIAKIARHFAQWGAEHLKK